MGYAGGYTTVKTFVQSIKEKKTRIAYMRFETEPGRQAQVDWGDFQIQQVGGKITTIYAFVMVMGYSRALYVEFVERPTLEAFMETPKIPGYFDCWIPRLWKGQLLVSLADTFGSLMLGNDISFFGGGQS